jgi:hypothetical protein
MARSTNKRWKILPPGAFAGKKIIFASTDNVDASQNIASEFMSTIFDLDPGDYLISDESSILDFTPFNESNTTDIWSRIESAYGINRADVDSELLFKVFESIAQRQRMQ